MIQKLNEIREYNKNFQGGGKKYNNVKTLEFKGGKKYKVLYNNY